MDTIKVLTLRTMPPTARNGRGRYNNKYFSKLYGVSATRIGNIRKGIEWKHLPVVNN